MRSSNLRQITRRYARKPNRASGISQALHPSNYPYCCTTEQTLRIVPGRNINPIEEPSLPSATHPGWNRHDIELQLSLRHVGDHKSREREQASRWSTTYLLETLPPYPLSPHCEACSDRRSATTHWSSDEPTKESAHAVRANEPVLVDEPRVPSLLLNVLVPTLQEISTVGQKMEKIFARSQPPQAGAGLPWRSHKIG